MLLLVGLGNPGREYAVHRHNVGFLALDAVARRHGLGAFRRRARVHGLLATGSIAGLDVAALKPQTFMNHSGLAVAAAARFFKIAPAAIFVFHDEIDLAPGKVRVKRDGGNAGHRGLASIDSQIGRDYWRVRIGIGHPGRAELVNAYVLYPFTHAEEAWLAPLLDALAEAAPLLVRGDAEGFMSRVALLAPPPGPAGFASTPGGAGHGL